MDISSIPSSYVDQITAALDLERTSAESFESVLQTAQRSGDNEEIMKACKEVEAYFLNVMFREMRKTVPSGGFIKKSQAEEIFQDMLDEQVSKNAAESGGIGLAQAMYKQMTGSSWAVPSVPLTDE